VAPCFAQQGQGAKGPKDGGGYKGESVKGQGTGQKGSIEDKVFRGKTDLTAAEEGDDDSDRPPWAGGNTGENPHISGTQGKPTGAGTKKGDEYGDLWVIIRNNDGSPVYVKWIDTDNDGVNDTMTVCESSAGCFVQPIAADGSFIPLDDEGAPIEAGLVQEVDIGRTNIARSPTKVSDHALEEALSKLDGGTLGIEVTQDEGGRLVIGDSTIDSPLENLALFEAVISSDTIVDGKVEVSIDYSGESGSGTYVFYIPEEDRLSVAASLLAAASDKTGVLSVDSGMAVSTFLDVEDELASLVTSYTYDRTSTYTGVQVWINEQTAGEETPDDPSDDEYKTVLVNVLDAVTFNTVANTVDENGDNNLDAVDEADNDGIDAFMQAADDALQVIEFIHDNAAE
jgi:hypothetical protein